MSIRQPTAELGAEPNLLRPRPSGQPSHLPLRSRESCEVPGRNHPRLRNRFADKKPGISEPSCATAGVRDVSFPAGCQNTSCPPWPSSLVNPRKPRSTYTSPLQAKHPRLCGSSRAVHARLHASGVLLPPWDWSWCSLVRGESSSRCHPPPQPPLALTFTSRRDVLLRLLFLPRNALPCRKGHSRREKAAFTLH